MIDINKYDFIWFCYNHLLENAHVEKTGYEFLSKSEPTADLVIRALVERSDEPLTDTLGITRLLTDDDRDAFLAEFDHSIRQTDQQHILDAYLDPKTKKDYRYITHHIEYVKNAKVWEEENRLSNYMGEQGKLMTTVLEIIKLDKYDDVWYALFRDGEGNIYFSKTTSRFLYGTKVGDQIKLKFRIKTFKEVNGVKQTVITHIRRKGLWSSDK